MPEDNPLNPPTEVSELWYRKTHRLPPYFKKVKHERNLAVAAEYYEKRKAGAKKTLTQTEIGAKFGISSRMVRKIINRYLDLDQLEKEVKHND